MQEKNKYITFIKKFTELRKLYQEYSFGDCPNLPAPFTEGLIALLDGLKKKENINEKKKHSKGNDLIDDAENEYEVKATSSSSGKTTAKLNTKFYQLIWLYFDFEKQIIFVRYINHKEFYDKFKDKIKSSDSKDKRYNVSLNKLKPCKEKKINMTELVKIE